MTLRPDELLSPLDPASIDAGVLCTGPPPCRPGVERGVIEPRRGYRFRPENLLLPWLVRERPASRLLDLGAGSGSLLMLAWYALAPEPARRACGVERQEDVAERLGRTIALHDASAQIDVVQGDLRDPACLAAARAALGGPADLIVANPPFFPAGWGQPSRNEGTRASTHAEHGDVADFARAAAALLAPTGRALFVFDAARLAHLLAAAAAADLGAVHVAWCEDARPAHAGEPYRVWVELAPSGGLPFAGPARVAVG